MRRCGWVSADPLYEAYHDVEWGVPERDGRHLFEILSLEGMQAGLSWLTILRKREGFRTAFAGFDPDVIADWGEEDVARLLDDAGIVRHRGKIEAVLGNARAWLTLGGATPFADLVWSFVDERPVQERRATLAEVPASTPVSTAMSKRLKAEGFRFCGPTTCYAFMQAAGLVNDHVLDCDRHDAVAALGGDM
ncbi:DNA-3-methyladenine glycosylase I [uncultured Jannaschia sp.]|uniref:DNA-3-methyladenine glycosylase I n=1 Tax=uncultured Jannaschia sp. TaxID=293347 RepID=UPI00262CB2B8|nr:DNA-3-methyladenine glycosylase I [uncultured Jannaschia sp.]